MQLCDTLHSSQNLVTILHVARALPFGHPVACVCQPVRTDTQTGWSRTGKQGAWFCQPHGIKMIEQGIGIGLGVHQVACPFVTGQVIIEPQECRLRDTGLLGTTAPVAYIMARA